VFSLKKTAIFLLSLAIVISMSGCKAKGGNPVDSDTTSQTTVTTTQTTTAESAVTSTTIATTASSETTVLTAATTAPTTKTKKTTTSAVTKAPPAVTTSITSVTPIITENTTTSEETTSDTCTQTSHSSIPLDDLLAGKPVIYLYPTVKTEVKVSLSFGGKLICTYPQYNGIWDVTASPDGALINKADGKQYSYLFWEGTSNTAYDLSKGFVVKGSDTSEFLQEKLSYLGLTPKEYNEFIVYWLPKMQNNNYNLITFQGKAYTDTAKLDITPEPDSIQRIFMVYKTLEKPISIEEQSLTPFERKGFSVIEWGGTEIK